MANLRTAALVNNVFCKTSTRDASTTTTSVILPQRGEKERFNKEAPFHYDTIGRQHRNLFEAQENLDVSCHGACVDSSLPKQGAHRHTQPIHHSHTITKQNPARPYGKHRKLKHKWLANDTSTQNQARPRTARHV